MDRVYDEIGGYTQEAVALDKEVKDSMKLLIGSELETGTPIEVLEHIMCNAIRTEILYQSIGLRIRNKGEKWYDTILWLFD